MSKAGRLGTRIWRQSRARAPAAGSAHPHNPDAANEGQSSIASRSTVVSAKGTCLSGQSSGKQERWGLGAAAAAKGTVLLSQLPSPDRYRDQRAGRAARGCGVAAAVLLRWLLEISPFAADAGRGGVAQPAAGLTGCPCVLGRGISVTRIRTLMARHTTGLPPPLADSTASAAAFRRAGRQLPLSGIKILGPGLICVRPEFTAALIRIHIDP